jgi:hypothetical protein
VVLNRKLPPLVVTRIFAAQPLQLLLKFDDSGPGSSFTANLVNGLKRPGEPLPDRFISRLYSLEK